MSLPSREEPPVKRQRARYHHNGETMHPPAATATGKETGEHKDGDKLVLQEEHAGPAEQGGEEEFRLLEAVSAVQDELNTLEEEEAQQVLLVHKAFLKRKRPLYLRRQAAISKVPDFWLKVLLAHPVTQTWISDGDQLALSYLESVAVNKASNGIMTSSFVSSTSPIEAPMSREELENRERDGAGSVKEGTGKEGAGRRDEADDDDDDVGFRVTFTFRENPFFTNKELWKEWEAADGQQAVFSAVKWKDTEEARDLQSSLVWNLDPTAAEETPSFFSIFCEDIDDYEVGEALRGEITDNPLDIYMRHDFDAEAEEHDETALVVHADEDVGNGEHGNYMMESEGGTCSMTKEEMW